MAITFAQSRRVAVAAGAFAGSLAFVVSGFASQTVAKNNWGNGVHRPAHTHVVAHSNNWGNGVTAPAAKNNWGN